MYLKWNTHFAHYSTVSIAEFEQVNAACAWETAVSDNKFVFSNCEKYFIQWARKIFTTLLQKVECPTLREVF